MHSQAINRSLISVHANVSCTMIVGGRLGKVSVPLEDTGRFYGRGQTGKFGDAVVVSVPQWSNTCNTCRY